MSLETQILLIVSSFFFGFFLEIIFNLNYKIIYYKNKIIKIIFTFIISFMLSLIYFYILLKINNGIIHISGILSLILGIITLHYLKSFYKRNKK